MARQMKKKFADSTSRLIAELDMPTPKLIMYKSNVKSDKGGAIHHRSCACLECQVTFQTESKLKNRHMRDNSEAACPECGTVAKPFNCADYPTQKYGTLVVNIPKRESVYGVYDDNGVLIRADRVLYYDNIRVYASDKMFLDHSREKTSYDLSEKQIYTSHISQDGKILRHENDANLFASNHRTTSERYLSEKMYKRTSPFVHAKRSDDIEAYPTFDYRQRNPIVYSLYDEIVAKRYDLPQSSELSDDVKACLPTMTNFAVMYPAVMQREMDIYNENYSYHPENHPEPKMERFRSVVRVERAIGIMDSKLSSDLHKAKSPEEVTDMLRAVTFGEDKGSLSGDIQTEDAITQGYGTLKNLKKEFNINPYATASNVRTMRKIGLTAPSHVKEMCDIAKQSIGRGPSSSDTACDGILRPIETRGQLRFIRSYANAHGARSVITDWYTATARGASSYEDCIKMYDKVCSVGKIASTKQDADDAKLFDARRQVKNLVDASGLDVACKAATFSQVWGDRAEECVKMLNELNERDAANGVAIPIVYATRNGEPLMSKSPSEIHDELSVLMKKVKEENQLIPHTADQIARFNRDCGEFRFQLAKDTDELVIVGDKMGICVASYGDSAVKGSEHIIIMYDKEFTPIGCLSTDRHMQYLDQAKAYHNAMICDAGNGSGLPISGEDAVKALEEYVSQTELETHKSSDWRNRNTHDYYPYGNRNFATPRRTVVRDYPTADYVVKRYNEIISPQLKIKQTQAIGSDIITETEKDIQREV